MTIPYHPFRDLQAKSDTVAMLKGEKKSMSEANYTQAAYTSKQRCSECKHYKKPDQKDSPCDVVVGIVSGDGVSDFFEKRT